MNKINSYKELIAWQKSMILVSEIYKLTKNFPSDEKFGIVSQLNRAVVSVPTNIAEGWGRVSRKNYLQFLMVSRGSLFETETLIIISFNQTYISKSEFEKTTFLLEEISKILNGLIKSIEMKVAEGAVN